jgi:hypothetical protein
MDPAPWQLSMLQTKIVDSKTVGLDMTVSGHSTTLNCRAQVCNFLILVHGFCAPAMPLNANEEALLGKPTAEDLEYEHQRLEYSPQERNKIGKWTIVALIINRTIGSGIFLTVSQVKSG